jgi:sec-independent protein translocase protein TatC
LWCGHNPSCAGCCCRLLFSYEILTPAALNFFVSYAEGAVESLWSIDQYFQFVLVLMLSTGLSFQVRGSS